MRSLAAVGTRHVDIAAKLAISDDTLARFYREELDSGRIDANAAIATTLFNKAKGGDTVAMIFWLKTRAGWREKSDLNVTSEDGSMSPPQRIEIIAVDPDGGSGSDPTSS